VLTLHGSGVGKGIAIGQAFILDRELPGVPQYLVARELIDEEVRRFGAAIDAARKQLRTIRRKLPADAPAEASAFLDAHLLMLEDKMLTEGPVASIREQQYNAEWALKLQAEALIAVFDRMRDPYLRNKKIDINQVVDRVQRNLLKLEDPATVPASGSLSGQIVVANDLTPADTVLLKHHRIAAFVTNLGGPISHTAILARGLKIPAIVGLHGATRYLRNGEEIIVDGKRGVLIISPDEQLLREYRSRRTAILRRRRELEKLRTATAVTRDGTRISLLANIELPGDVRAVKACGARGVGLYRTEFLYMNREAPPGEAEQYAAYTRVTKALGRVPVTIRTADLGADKSVDGRSGDSVNPALGMRAIRLCLHDPALFRPQLRAILRASAHGPVQMMIPMVSNIDELNQVKDLVAEVRRELARAGEKFNPRLPIGGMIEVPAAAISADMFARNLDFLSIGTNDLIQYTLAIDRVDDTVNYLYDPLHPAVLRLIRTVIKAGEDADIPVTMCGEMAGDVRYTRLLLGMGLRVFSMDPANVLEVKKVIRESDLGKLIPAARRVLAARDTDELRRRFKKLSEGD